MIINCMFGIRTREEVTRAKGKDYCSRICGDLRREHLTRDEMDHQIARTDCAAVWGSLERK